MSDLVIIERQDVVSIADAVRSKTGETKDLTIGEMIDGIKSSSGASVNLDEEVATQNNLIAQIQTALENKVVGSSGTSVDTCTVNFWNDIIYGQTRLKFIVSTLNGGKVCVSNTGEIDGLNSTSLENVICGSLAMVIPINSTFGASEHTVYIGSNTETPIATTYHYFTIPNEPNTEINISVGM